MQIFPEYESFKHGLIVSKLWLCEELESILEKKLYKNPTVHILAGWHNILSFIMIIRKPNLYKKFFSYDMNDEFTIAADKLCDTWKIEKPQVINLTADVNHIKEYETSHENLFINCSVDQIEGTQWYDNIPKGSLVCLQTTNLDILGHPWYIKTITKTSEDFRKKFLMSEILFSAEKEINYTNWGYKRLMLIGIK